MKEILPLGLIVGLVAIIALLYVGGLYLELQWRLPWYDYVLHAMGGAWVSIITIGLLYKLGHITHASHLVFLGIVGALVIGLVWEGFELGLGLTKLDEQGFLSDTIGDFIFDACGSIIGSLYMSRRLKELSLWLEQK
jgi:hypothetical protein